MTLSVPESLFAELDMTKGWAVPESLFCTLQDNMILEEMESSQGPLGDMGWQTKDRLNKLGVSGMRKPHQDAENPEAANHLLHGHSLSDAAKHLEQISAAQPMNGNAKQSPSHSMTKPKPPLGPGFVPQQGYNGFAPGANDLRQRQAGTDSQSHFGQQLPQQYGNGTAAYDMPQIAPFDGPTERGELEMSRRTPSGNPLSAPAAPSAAWQ